MSFKIFMFVNYNLTSIHKFSYSCFFYNIFFSYKIIAAYSFVNHLEAFNLTNFCQSKKLQVKIYFSNAFLRQKLSLVGNFLIFSFTNSISSIVDFFSNIDEVFFSNVIFFIFFSFFLI